MKKLSILLVSLLLVLAVMITACTPQEPVSKPTDAPKPTDTPSKTNEPAKTDETEYGARECRIGNGRSK